jgi:hypothetical protein
MQRDTSLSNPTLVVAAIALVGVAITWFALKPGHDQAPPQDSNTTASAEQPAAAPPAEQSAADDDELRPQSAAERSKALQAL